jgi:hypothetical protein
MTNEKSINILDEAVEYGEMPQGVDWKKRKLSTEIQTTMKNY